MRDFPGAVRNPAIRKVKRPWVLFGLHSEDKPHIPTGIQIIANTFDDRTAFRVAAAFSNSAPALFTGNAFPDYRNQKVIYSEAEIA